MHGNNNSYFAFVGFTFRDCYAATLTYGNIDRGGAASNITLVDCVVSNCVATRGGALQGCAAHRCRLTGNRATSSSNGAASNASGLYNCLVDHNVGASPLSYSGSIVNSTIADNSSDYAVFNQASGNKNEICNTLIVRNGKNGATNVKNSGNELHFKSIVTQCTKASYTGGASSGAVVDVDDASKCEISPDQFADSDNLDYRVTSASDAVGAGLATYLEGKCPPSWVCADSQVRDYAGNVIDLTKGTVQAGCLQEVYVLPPTVFIDADAADVEVEGGVIGENEIGTDPIVVKAKRAETRPFLGFAVDGAIVTRATSIDLTTLDVQPGERKTLTAVYGTVWYVKQTDGDDANSGAYPDAAKQTIKAAATNAVSGDVVKVYPGVYGEADGAVKHTTPMNKDTDEIRIPTRVVVNAGVTIEAVEGAEKTFVVGQSDPDVSTAYPVFGLGPKAVRCVILEKNATIKGFTITGGRVDKAEEVGGKPVYDDNFDCGGILCRSRGTCLVVDCVVSNNVADEGGFGMDCTFVRSLIVANIGVRRPASRRCDFYGCYLDDNSGGNMEHVMALDSCTVGPTCWNEAHSKEITAIQYPTKGGSFRNSIVLAKSIWQNTQTASYLYAVTNCVFLESTRSALEDDGEHAALGNCTFIANAAAAGLDENFRPVPGQTIAEILDAVTPEYEAMTDASTLAAYDASGVPRVLNGARDLGAFEGDWRPRYSSDIGGRAQVVEASPDVVEANGKVTIPGGSKIVFTLNNKSAAAKEYALNVTVTGGTLSVLVDGESVEFSDAANIVLPIASGTHRVDVVFAGEKPDTAIIQSLRNQSGMMLFVR